MTANKKITVKSLSEEFYKLKDDFKEFTALKKKVFELEDALKTCEKDKEILKEQLKVFGQKVETMEKQKIS